MLHLIIVSAVLFCALPFSNSIAKEVIKRFDSLVQVAKDGSFTVTETIVVKAESRKIKRGIYRDFPLFNEDENGKRREVGFELLSVKRDDKVENTRIEKRKNGIRIYIGRKNHFLPKGIYTYTITYKTDRQMRYFENHDEIYWNATGNFWDFPIETVLAQIVLPEGAAATDWDVFTGRQGAKGKDATVGKIAGKRVVKYRTTRTLNAREGMTILAKVDKGVIDPPSEAQKSAWFWKDNKAMIVGLIGLAIVSLYYFITWWRIGRDLPEGTIVPRWDLPDNMSPAMVNYIDQKGLAGKGFDAISAGFLNLAVKGFVTLEKKTKNLHITATDKVANNDKLPVGEASLLRRVQLSSGQKLEISKSNGSKVKSLQVDFASAMEKEHRGKFYNYNGWMVVLGIILSVFTLLMVVTVGAFSEEIIGFMGASFVVTVFISIFVFNFVKGSMQAKNLAGKIINLIFTGIFMFGLMSAGLGVVATGLLTSVTDPWPIVTVVGIVVLNVLFFFLLGAPTALGRQKMDEIEGLKTYLTFAEKDRMNMKNAPDFSTAHYEELLPYAVALGVEKPWSKSFETWLAAAIAAGAVAASYNPNWYSGRNFDSGDLSGSMDNLSSSMQDGFSSAMPVPKSSSSGFSGGGGSSGGGGGGGGGGGW